MHKLELASVSLPGDRDVNEDFQASRLFPEAMVLVCADGLGGHDCGELASEFFVRGLIECAESVLVGMQEMHENGAPSLATRWFGSGADYMHARFKQRNVHADALTTAVAAVVTANNILLAHCGDSRAYRLRPQQTAWRTQDHSIPQMLVDAGELDEAQMGTHRDQGKLTNAISRTEKPQPSASLQAPLAPGEVLLLCTDGFWEHLEEHELMSLASKPLVEQLAELAATACKRGAGKSDNVTALAARHTP
jgi:serine/threonine protein phosphatase PrpC